ncbi:MAG: V-type ATP synthase subunit D [Candidatus Thermoplasmatota archaeon]|nr:V-type ATP synthase subunit D [Candidatus Thermoplasmatota archaeon]MCK4456391.1 V-type ATP synthase subunit D [Thermoplasmata archaeon]
MVREYKATRSELLELKKQIKLSTTGHRLLKMKRDSLIAEFFKILDKAKGIRSGIQDKYDRAMERLSIAKAIEGTIGVKSAAFAALENPEMELTTKNIMGIVVPEIQSRSVKKRIDERGYGIIGTSSRIDEAAEAFEDLVEDIVIAAEIETTMRRLLDEIEKTRRRVNALEFRVIPNLESQEAFIRLRLEELERENIFRLKRFKEA